MNAVSESILSLTYTAKTYTSLSLLKLPRGRGTTSENDANRVLPEICKEMHTVQMSGKESTHTQSELPLEKLPIWQISQNMPPVLKTLNSETAADSHPTGPARFRWSVVGQASGCQAPVRLRSLISRKWSGLVIWQRNMRSAYSYGVQSPLRLTTAGRSSETACDLLRFVRRLPE